MYKMQIGLVMACMTALGYMMGSDFSSMEQHTTFPGEGLSLFAVEVAKPFPVEPLKTSILPLIVQLLIFECL